MNTIIKKGIKKNINQKNVEVYNYNSRLSRTHNIVHEEKVCFSLIYYFFHFEK